MPSNKIMGGQRSLFIKNPKAYQLARALSERTGQTITNAVIGALEQEIRRQAKPLNRDAIERLCKRAALLPVLDPRTTNEIIGYDGFGVPE